MPPLINYDSPVELRAFLDARGLGMRKKFGQNFLINRAARSMLHDALELKPGDEVWEIGPGLGAMTAGLLERGGQVTAFEIDPSFARLLLDLFALESDRAAFRLVEGDVFKTWPSVKAEGELLLLGNLPYNIAAALLADFIEKGRFFKRMVVTVQREVALRMAAGPGSIDYSSFSVLCSSAYKISLLSTINSKAFFPAPRVDSRGVRLDLLETSLHDGLSAIQKRPALFYPLVRALFSCRRKTIKNTLSAFASSVIIKQGLKETAVSSKEAAAEALTRAGISGERRPETLAVDDFAGLAAFLEEIVSYDG